MKEECICISLFKNLNSWSVFGSRPRAIKFKRGKDNLFYRKTYSQFKNNTQDLWKGYWTI